MRQPDTPAVTREEHDLEKLRAEWAGTCHIGLLDGRWHADAGDGAGRIVRASAAGLDLALRLSRREGRRR